MLYAPHHVNSLLPAALGLLVLGCPSALLGASNFGPDWDGDSLEDAGAVPSTAQRVQKDDSNAVVVIRGELKGEDEEGGEGLASAGDYQDMYEVVIMSPGEFEISTIGPIGFSEFDSALSVYDAEGRALLANEDADQGTDASRVGNSSTNGKFQIDRPGVVYIAISGVGTRARNANGQSIFAWSSDPSDVVGPAFPAGEQPIDSWEGDGATGEYAIHLSAVGPVPSGCAVENTEDCFVPHPTPYCSDGSCCEQVCLLEPFCCEVSWDLACAEIAIIECSEQPCDQDCLGDLDQDQQVSGSDLAILMANWGGAGCTDLDQNGVTNGADLAILLANWGGGCGEDD